MNAQDTTPFGSPSPDIALVMPDFSGGGAERMMTRLARGLSDLGRNVEMVVCANRGPFQNACGANVRIVELGSPNARSALLPLIRYLRRRRPRSVLVTLQHMSLVLLLARSLAGVKVRVVVREANNPLARRHTRRRRRVVAAAYKLWLRRADAVIAVSEGVASAVVSWAGLPGARVHAIFNPLVDRDVIALAEAPVDHAFFETSGPPVLLAAGRLTPQKDFVNLLQAITHLRSDTPVRLILLGEGPERPALESFVAEHGLSTVVSMPGFVDNPYAFMRRAAVFVLSSAWEGLPGVLVQALACGCPVVSTDCPSGPREILEEGRYGELVPVNDPVALADAIARTLSAPPDPALLIRRASEFSVERAVALYDEVLMPSGQ